MLVCLSVDKITQKNYVWVWNFWEVGLETKNSLLDFKGTDLQFDFSQFSTGEYFTIVC